MVIYGPQVQLSSRLSRVAFPGDKAGQTGRSSRSKRLTGKFVPLAMCVLPVTITLPQTATRGYRRGFYTPCDDSDKFMDKFIERAKVR